MDLLVVTWNYPPRRGGIENLVASLCEEFRKNHSVQIITAHARNGAKDKKVFRAPLPGLMGFAGFVVWRGASLLLRERRVRIVFGGSALVTPLVLLLARLFRRRAVVQVHGLDVSYRKPIYQWLCVRWLKFCDQVVANSRFTARLAQMRGVSRDRTVIIPPGVGFERFDTRMDVAAVKRGWGIEGKKIILFVGRLARRKGVKEFIENSLVDVVREIPQAVFLIVGSNPTESLAHHDDVAGEIKAAVSKLGLEGEVRLLGPIGDEELIKAYQACDLVVLPALNVNDDIEGFGIVALEAAAAGKPVVATRVGGIPDAVQDGETGVLVEPGDYRTLSRTIVMLLKSIEQRTSLGESGRRRASTESTWSHIAARYEAAFTAMSDCGTDRC